MAIPSTPPRPTGGLPQQPPVLPGGVAPQPSAAQQYLPVADPYAAPGEGTYADTGFYETDSEPAESAFAAPVDSDLPVEAVEAARLLLQVIGDDESSEVIINGPNEVLQKVKGTRYHIPNIQFGDAETLHRVLNEYVLPYCDTAERIDGLNIEVQGQLELPPPPDQPHLPPMLARVHILCPPLVQFAKVTIAKKARYELDLDTMVKGGAMSQSMADYLKAAAHGRLTIVVSGPTGAGKTTLLQALSRNYDQNDRIVVIEDTPELRLPLADVVYLQSTQAKPGVRADDVVTTEWLVKATQRMRMDRVIVGECRGAEMAEWLIAANSGAEGSATTVHADNPRRALDKILSLATKSPTAASESTLRREIAATVDLVVQAGLVDGEHVVTAIEEVSNTVRETNGTGLIATQTLFAYDRGAGRHVVAARPSEDQINTLRQRGVQVNPNWFRGSLS